jgi:hypothetical protein
MNDWKKRWQGREMDQCAREEKRTIKKKKVRDNRRACKNALKKHDYDNINVTNWDDLDANDD